MQLPDPIARYFEADATPGGAAPVALFAPEARVFDEGETHVGRAAIAAWWQQAKQKYRHRAEPLECLEVDGVSRVRARVSGAFPGSPAVLSFAFTLAGGEIESLGIGG